MFKKLFGKPKSEPTPLESLETLREQLEDLEKKERVLQKKADAEYERAKQFSAANNKRAAIRCLNTKKKYERDIEANEKYQLNIHNQMITLEGAKGTMETLRALRTGASALKAMQASMNIDDVEKTMDEINEQTENMRQIQEALSMSIGGDDFDQDELEAELQELGSAELEAQLLQPVATTFSSSASIQVPVGKQPTRPPIPTNPTAEVEELAALQAEMTL